MKGSRQLIRGTGHQTIIAGDFVSMPKLYRFHDRGPGSIEIIQGNTVVELAAGDSVDFLVTAFTFANYPASQSFDTTLVEWELLT